VALPFHLLHTIPADHLIYSSPEPESWTLLQSLTGLGVFLAAIGAARSETAGYAFRRALAWAIVVSAATLGAATLLDVMRQWSQAGFGGWFLLRYANGGDRFTLHLADVNAAGSHYVLAAITCAALVALEPQRRLRAGLFLALILPALWLTGSRSSYLGFAAGLGILWAIHRQWRPSGQTRKVAAVAAFVLILGAALMADWQAQEQGSAGRAINLRAQFSQTTARMFAASPVFGVGIGHYFNRSAEFMSDELRSLYGNENAHNYFAQQFAELGLGGGLLFLWLVVIAVTRGWRGARQEGAGAPWIGLFAGSTAYVLTCLTGHPLLVPETALPFWVALGSVAIANKPVSATQMSRIGVAAAVLWLAAGIGTAGAVYARTPIDVAPAESGFHGVEMDANGTPFRWLTRHAVTYIPADAGFLRLRLRAPDRVSRRPLIVETSIAGRVVDRREISGNQWVTYDIPAPARGQGFRRVDVRVNQEWLQDVQLGRRKAQRPITVMAAEIALVPLR
jgi:O-antigen ligase